MFGISSFYYGYILYNYISYYKACSFYSYKVCYLRFFLYSIKFSNFYGSTIYIFSSSYNSYLGKNKS